ncbi:MAG TPA: Asp-tRNA(Asn)/Glu-tRNA(Gln) amidotransferase subunit GatB [Candidatus Moranbacteria bacterium]|nr:Asp-tRNA(Asn)/Glu-tRNA(Gln) amidotransferase subunit GatB [Candidatus Moranbacteria bacterium]
MKSFVPVIGMEIHCQLKTDSKMFSPEPNGLGLEETPNVHIDPVVTAQPGTLPVPNEKAIRFVQMAGLALGCELASRTKFDRKNYFYPDLPKGYQISQYDRPLCRDGRLTVDGAEIGITRIHIEEDTGRLQHPTGADYTLVDLNRAGVPLMELVTEPDLTDGRQARLFCQELQKIIRYLGISDADMEKGQMRCEVNISLHRPGEDKLSGTKVEIKNLNSFRAVERAVNYEIKRQSEVLSAGEEVKQETRGWSDEKGVTFSQRAKESAHDYRYFPEPDIPPMVFDEEYFASLRARLPELPAAKRKRFAAEYGLSKENLEVIVADKDLAAFFENTVSELREKRVSGEIAAADEVTIRLAANYIVSELQKHLVADGRPVADLAMSPENFAELIGLIADSKINSSAAQIVLEKMYRAEVDLDPSNIVEEENLAQESDEGVLAEVIASVLAENLDSVADYRAGKTNALKFLMGQVMKKTAGKANPQTAVRLLKEELEKRPPTGS